jgi:putative zinc finger/helix-turn-helix YgiT family protein
MKTMCPICERKTDIEIIKKGDIILVRGEKVPVSAEYLRCVACGEEFENTRGYDALEKAYREYRKKYRMLQPEEIRDFRKNYGLTQKEFGDLLGFGGATLSRYENGALQSEAHEKLLRLSMDVRNLLSLIEKDFDNLLPEKRDRLLKKLKNLESESCSLDRIYEENFGNYSLDELSGYKKLDLKKLYNMILFFCLEGQFKTKLNKLLFYADFKFFREYTISISGARYAHLELGPGPDKYEFFLANLIHNSKSLRVEEITFPNYVGENYKAIKPPDSDCFDEKELSILEEVKKYFKDFTSSQIKGFSHREKGYKETQNGELISYEYSKELQI